jgi:hypothetical protein
MQKMTMPILNSSLAWDGTHLGSYTGDVAFSFMHEGVVCNYLVLPQGMIYCLMKSSKDCFACIVEDIKPLFGLTRRGIHRIKINGAEQTLYRVSVTSDGVMMSETPLNKLDSKHHLRKDPIFRLEMQKLLTFCDIMALTSTSESTIRLHKDDKGYIPVNINERDTTLKKGAKYDYSIIGKMLYLNWFGETTSQTEVLRIMLAERGFANLTTICHNQRTAIDAVINKYDSNYIWYSNFIIDRMSRILLNV